MYAYFFSWQSWNRMGKKIVVKIWRFVLLIFYVKDRTKIANVIKIGQHLKNNGFEQTLIVLWFLLNVMTCIKSNQGTKGGGVKETRNTAVFNMDWIWVSNKDNTSMEILKVVSQVLELYLFILSHYQTWLYNLYYNRNVYYICLYIIRPKINK